ncbi:MAG: ATP-dependent zinc metalloprotease FtsH [Clostridia bacterium]|nr:ATP-dependent zinc metalloprotease FtsH [Clostridia bacterium]
MKKNLKSIGFYLLLLVILIVVYAFMGTQPAIEKHTMSDLLRSIEKQEVTGLVLEDDRAIASLTSGGEMVVEIPSADLFLIFATAEIKELVAQNPDFVFTTPSPASAPWWLSMIPTIIFILLMVVFYFFIFRQMQGGGGGGKVMNFGKSRAKTLANMGKKVTFNDVAGADEEKADLEEIVDFLKSPEKYTKLGARIPKGVLLVGPPGTGKTLLAKAVAGEAGVPFFSISGSDFVEMFVGVGAARVRDLFEEAKKSTPSVIFIDEIDAVGRHRGAGLGGGHDEREQTLNQLLVEMDGFGVNEGIIIIAATNRPDILDPALLRPGRFDRQIVVNTPDVGGREDILKVHAKNKTLAPDVDLKVVAKTTAGFTGADLENLLNEAALLAAGKSKTYIDNDDIQVALMKVMMGAEKKSRKMSDKEKRLTAIHEAGHAVITRLFPGQDPVHEVSIIPRGMAGGYTMHLPTEDKFYVTKNYMLEEINILLGGRVAEQLILGDISTGASNDIERASDLARKMVTKYGMSEKVGPITFGSSNNEVFIGKDWTQTKSFSEELASVIDKEVSGIIDSCYKNTIKLLEENKDKLLRVADALVEFEKIDGPTFEKLFTFENSEVSESEESNNNVE